MRISDWSSDVCSSDLVVNATNNRRGIEIKPNRFRSAFAQEGPAPQGWSASGITPTYKRLWYAATSHPAATSGNAYLKTCVSEVARPTARTKTSGNMTMRWYQQSSQGSRPMISLRNKAPRVAQNAQIHAEKKR